MSKIFTPTNQIRLTNVAIVRMKKAGKRFEIACYKNKVLNWRNKVEKDIDEVLQTHTVFTNVSKGAVAKKEDLVAAFGTEDQSKIALIILDKGELQVSGRERQEVLEASVKDVANLISSLCINPDSKRAYPSSMIEKGLKDIHFSVKPNRSPKQLALEAIPQLSTVMKIQRAQMRLKVTASGGPAKGVSEKVGKLAASVEEKVFEGGTVSMVILIDPGYYRQIEELMQAETKGQGLVEVLSLKEVVDTEERIE